MDAGLIGFCVGMGVATAAVLVVGQVVSRKLFGFNVGGRRFRSYDDFVATVASETGLAGDPATGGMMASLSNLTFKGRLPSTDRPAKIVFDSVTMNGVPTDYFPRFGVAVAKTLRFELDRKKAAAKVADWAGLDVEAKKQAKRLLADPNVERMVAEDGMLVVSFRGPLDPTHWPWVLRTIDQLATHAAD
jgi:hypothetical protein